MLRSEASNTSDGPSTGRTDVVVLAGGDAVSTPLPRPLPSDALVIAADSGLAAAATLHLDVDLIVGDLDSVDPDALAAAEAAGVPVDRHPVDKDRTDLAIALDAALDRGATSITVVGGAGGRLDHLAAGLLLLGAPAYRSAHVRALVGDAVVTVVRDRAQLTGRVGALVSLLPLHGEATGVTTDGLRFPLDDEVLRPGSSRGVSNELTATTASVALRDGTLLAIQPGATAPDPTEA